MSLTLDEAALAVSRGGVVVYPTLTLYGVGGDARLPGVAERVRAIKGRGNAQPFIILVASVADLEPLVVIGAVAERLIAAFWPGPLTLLLPACATAPAELVGPDGLIGVRLAEHPTARALVERTGAWLISTSANPHGQPAPQRAADIDPGLLALTDGLLAGDPEPAGVPTTIVGLPPNGPPTLVRAGIIACAEINCALSPMELSDG